MIEPLGSVEGELSRGLDRCSVRGTPNGKDRDVVVVRRGIAAQVNVADLRAVLQDVHGGGAVGFEQEIDGVSEGIEDPHERRDAEDVADAERGRDECLGPG